MRIGRAARTSDAQRTSLGALAVSGASAVRLAFQFALMPILARLIGPSEYGLVALAMPFILLANVLADGGLVMALGRQKDPSPAMESTAFWIAAGIGAVLALASCALAWPISLGMREPRLAAMIVALSPILLMNSLTVVSNGRIIRERRFGLFAGGDLISTVAGAVTALAAATHGWGAWSLVAQQIVLWACKLAWVSLRAGTRIQLTFRFAEVREVLIFGANSLGATLADYVSRNLDNLIVGAVLGVTALGYYAMAYQLIRIPDMLISGPFYYYIFTALARVSHTGDRSAIERLATAGLRLGATALAPLFCGLALIADLAVGVVLGPKWLGAIAALRWLAAAGLGFCLCSIMAAMMTGLGRAGLQLRLAVLLSLVTIATVGGAARFGLEAVSAALACGVAVVCGYYLDRLARDLKAPRLTLVLTLGPAALGCLTMAAAVYAVRRLLVGEPALVVLGAALVTGALVYLAVIWLIARRRLMADAQAFGRAHGEVVRSNTTPEAADRAHALSAAG
jgi:O-antigen/teichoic acid export membrane protein